MLFVSTPVKPTGFFVFSPTNYPQKPLCSVSGKLSSTPKQYKVAHLLRFFWKYLCHPRFLTQRVTCIKLLSLILCFSRKKNKKRVKLLSGFAAELKKNVLHIICCFVNIVSLYVIGVLLCVKNFSFLSFHYAKPLKILPGKWWAAPLHRTRLLHTVLKLSLW